MMSVKDISIPFTSKTAFLIKRSPRYLRLKGNNDDRIPRRVVFCNVNKGCFGPIIHLSLNSSAVMSPCLFSEMKEGLLLKVTVLSHDNYEILK